MSPTERVREMEKMVNRSHVLVVPLPGAGHINPMLQFSSHVCSPKGSKSPSSHQQIPNLFKPYPCCNIRAFLGLGSRCGKGFRVIFSAFFTHACAVDYIFYNVYHEALKMPVSSTPVLIEGLPLLLELQDLPTFVVLLDSYPANVKMTMSQFANLDKADWILIDTFYKLECESKLVEDAWKVGVRAKVDEHGIVKREEIAICIKEVMEGDRGREMKMNSKKWKELAIELQAKVELLILTLMYW
ncbi:hypothetical protein NC652_007896 [Populus alba x Populus x berolinensis]|nr:hypothetical protein NC652_007891 [Populus alba x Populus x berolinensis]KAJ6941955.1 hypothetical protein NC652_007896 [Populus alba x Populus x berolinensis]